jgi:hypothetical protein
VNDVKNDISREVELEELRRLRAEMEATARNMQETISSHASKLEQEFRSVDNELQGIGRDLDAAADALDDQVRRNTTSSTAQAPAAPAAPLASSAGAATAGTVEGAKQPSYRDPLDDELERAIAEAEWLGNSSAAPSPAAAPPAGATALAASELPINPASEVDPRQGVLPLFDAQPEPPVLAGELQAAKDSKA